MQWDFGANFRKGIEAWQQWHGIWCCFGLVWPWWQVTLWGRFPKNLGLLLPLALCTKSLHLGLKGSRGEDSPEGENERGKEVVVWVCHIKDFCISWIYLDFSSSAVNMCHLFGIILISKSQAFVYHQPAFNRTVFVMFRQTAADIRAKWIGLPVPFHWNKARPLALIIGTSFSIGTEL